MPTPEARAARVPALLTTSKYMGTLATVRCLGARGVPVVVATASVLGPAQWSRAASRVVRGRPRPEPESMLAWLLELGERHAGAVLHPTSDEIAWLIARHADRLARAFRLYAPSFGAVRALLDKSELHHLARRVGLRTPDTLFPRSEAEAERAARSGRTFVVKPRSQVFYSSHAKGAIVSGAAAVADAWRACRAAPHAEGVRDDAPDIDMPMLQELVPTVGGVYSISGFVTRDFEVLAPRGARKILQRPAGVGVGVCFAAEPVSAPLVAKLGALARAVGFFGAFEAEFVGDAAPCLIDFNPRYYGQMAFDIARGAPLPWMLHLGALGFEEALRAQPASDAGAPRVYGDRIALRIMLASRRLAGTLAPDAARRWRGWLREHARSAVDATLAPGDPLPAVASALATLWDAARHPRGYWRSLQGAL